MEAALTGAVVGWAVFSTVAAVCLGLIALTMWRHATIVEKTAMKALTDVEETIVAGREKHAALTALLGKEQADNVKKDVEVEGLNDLLARMNDEVRKAGEMRDEWADQVAEEKAKHEESHDAVKREVTALLANHGITIDRDCLENLKGEEAVRGMGSFLTRLGSGGKARLEGELYVFLFAMSGEDSSEEYPVVAENIADAEKGFLKMIKAYTSDERTEEELRDYVRKVERVSMQPVTIGGAKMVAGAPAEVRLASRAVPMEELLREQEADLEEDSVLEPTPTEPRPGDEKPYAKEVVPAAEEAERLRAQFDPDHPSYQGDSRAAEVLSPWTAAGWTGPGSPPPWLAGSEDRAAIADGREPPGEGGTDEPPSRDEPLDIIEGDDNDSAPD